MESNTYPPRPEWLTDKQIEAFRKCLKECPNPYTDEDMKNWQYDGENDMLRKNARTAKQILTKYGLLEEE